MLGQRHRRWANISYVLGQRLGFDCLHQKMGHTDGERTHRHKLSGQTERTKVNQHVPTSSEGRHNFVLKSFVIKSFVIILLLLICVNG